MGRTRINIAMITSDFMWGGGAEFLALLAKALTYSWEGRAVYITLALKKEINENKDRGSSGNLRKIKTFFRRGIKDLIHLRMPKFSMAKTPNNKKDISVFDNNKLLNYFIGMPRVRCLYYDGSEMDLEAKLVAARVDIILPIIQPLSKNFSIPWIGYLYDFQHKKMPDLFSEEEIKVRDYLFSKIASCGDYTIVNSKAVAEDFHFYYPDSLTEIIFLPFCPVMNKSSRLRWRTIRKKYKLPRRYFLVSNQFWMHKDHITAFEALKKVIETEPGADIHIVCTGLTGDYRSPEYFTSLMDSIRRLGIAERVHVLGHIPKRDQMAIMRKCIAVVQPTLFEGGPGGGSVYNSIAAGIYSIVSDIAVNLEIPKNDHVVFFKAQDASDLSEKMLDAIANPRARIGWLRLRVNEKRRLRAMRDVLLPKIEQSIGRKQARGRG